MASSEVEASAAGTTTSSPDTDRAAFLGGFVAAEGCFTGSKNQYRFALALGAVDRGMCELAREVIGVGHIREYKRRKSHYDDEVVFVVQSAKDLIRYVVPFMDAYLPESQKRVQYLAWRKELTAYWDNEATRRRSCTIDGCERPQKGKGVCRQHYWTLYGK